MPYSNAAKTRNPWKFAGVPQTRQQISAASGPNEGTFGPLLRAKFHPHRCNMSPLRGEKPQNRPLSKLNTGRFALRAMLPVTTQKKQVIKVI